LPDPTWLQFRRRFDKLAPFCRVASHTSEEVRDILSTLEQEYQPLFPQLRLSQWTSSIYAWLTHPVLDPTRSGRVTMDNLMKLVVTALEWSYLDGKTDVAPSRLKSAAELLVLRHDTLKLIDGAGPTTLAPDRDIRGRARCEWERTRTANRAGKRTAEHGENGGTCERTGANEDFTQLHVFWRTGSHRSQTIYRQRHQSGGMSSLWKNAFSLPK